MSQKEFRNLTYFIFPLKVGDREKLLTYLQGDERWEPAPGLETIYLLRYAEEMNASGDGRLRRYAVKEPSALPIHTFDKYIAQQMEKRGLPSTGETAKIEEISLYVFGDGVAFLEFCVDYGGMSLAEILSFVFCFRSLRNDETKGWLLYPKGAISAQTAIDRLLPGERSGTELCFSTRSPVKRQANVFSIVNPTLCSAQEDMDAERRLHLLAHGYNPNFDSLPMQDSRYEMSVSFRKGEDWGGCQDALACIVENPYTFQFDHLSGDYHFLYLLLLNQRYSLISYIDAFSRETSDQEQVQRLHRGVVDLKLRYSFRIVSDTEKVQTIYNELYEIFEIDHLLKDLDESGEQLNELLQREQARREGRLETILTALSILAVFSAFVDLSDYLEKFREWPPSWPTFAGLFVNALIIVCGLFIAFRRRK